MPLANGAVGSARSQQTMLAPYADEDGELFNILS
jgi:hypothetical protein